MGLIDLKNIKKKTKMEGKVYGMRNSEKQIEDFYNKNTEC